MAKLHSKKLLGANVNKKLEQESPEVCLTSDTVSGLVQRCQRTGGAEGLVKIDWGELNPWHPAIER